MIHQGDVYWVYLNPPVGSGPGYRHPHVVIQNNSVNASALRSVILCPLTANLRRGAAPGNVLLEKGEAGLPKQSVVNVSQVITVDKAELGERIGALSPARVRQVLDGVHLLLEPRDPVA